VKLTRSRKKENIGKEREVEEKKKNILKNSTKENSRERWWMVKEQIRQPNF
jgi:hypothetical protein